MILIFIKIAQQSYVHAIISGSGAVPIVLCKVCTRSMKKVKKKEKKSIPVALSTHVYIYICMTVCVKCMSKALGLFNLD